MAEPSKPAVGTPAGAKPRSIHDRWADDETPVKVLSPPTSTSSPDSADGDDLPAGVKARQEDVDWGLHGPRPADPDDDDIDLESFKPQ